MNSRQVSLPLLVLLLAFSISYQQCYADVTVIGPVSFKYSSDGTATGANGTVRILATYTFASPITLTNATETPPLGELFFNLTGKTASLPSSQLKFEAWNTTNTGTIPITIQTKTVYPTYILNASSYSYLNPNMTMSTLRLNKTVTVDFSALGGYGIKVFACGGTIISAPTYSLNILTVVVADSGLAGSTITQIYGAGEMPWQYTVNGSVPSPLLIGYSALTDTISLTGTGTWILHFHQTAPGPGDGGGETVIPEPYYPPTSPEAAMYAILRNISITAKDINLAQGSFVVDVTSQLSSVTSITLEYMIIEGNKTLYHTILTTDAQNATISIDPGVSRRFTLTAPITGTGQHVFYLVVHYTNPQGAVSLAQPFPVGYEPYYYTIMAGTLAAGVVLLVYAMLRRKRHV